MEILIAMIGIPLLALLIWHFDSTRRFGLDRAARDFARRALFVLGVVVLAHAGLFLVWFAIAILEQGITGAAAIGALLRLILVGFLFYAGWAAVCVSGHEERDDLTLTQLARRERQHDSLQVGEFALICLPLIVPGTLVLSILAGVLGFEFALFAITGRARENQLLWTLALAAKHKLPVEDEIEALAATMREDSRGTLVFRILLFFLLWHRIWTGRYERQLFALADSLRSGTSLPRALLYGPRLLPLDTCAAIQSASENGTLHDVLPDLAVRHTRRLKAFHLDSAMNNVVMYLWAMGAIMASITAFLCVYIVPKFKDIFNDFGFELPQLTQRALGHADFAVSYWFLVIPVFSFPFLVIFGTVYFGIGTSRWTPSILLQLFPRLVSPTLLRALGHAVRRRETAEGTLKALHDAATASPWAGRLARIQRRLESGIPVAEAVRSERFVTDREAAALAHAEQIGHLPWALGAIADKIEQARINRFRFCFEFIKPVSILLLGGVVLYVLRCAVPCPLVRLVSWSA